MRVKWDQECTECVSTPDTQQACGRHIVNADEEYDCAMGGRHSKTIEAALLESCFLQVLQALGKYLSEALSWVSLQGQHGVMCPWLVHPFLIPCSPLFSLCRSALLPRDGEGSITFLKRQRSPHPLPGPSRDLSCHLICSPLSADTSSPPHL